MIRGQQGLGILVTRSLGFCTICKVSDKIWDFLSQSKMFCTREELQCFEKKCRYCKLVASFPCKDQTRGKFSKLVQIGNEILKDKFHSKLKC